MTVSHQRPKGLQGQKAKKAKLQKEEEEETIQVQLAVNGDEVEELKGLVEAAIEQLSITKDITL
jgi:hypothetical protein